ncbi:MAG: hypothetical protein LBV16_09330 [Elusimicrobiota bacterium]|jgi:hypothetical protein|nr:hypothetical protein [Elusimicrobiota bacterium]
MEVILGKPQVRGNSDVVYNYAIPTAVSAGTALKRTGDKEAAAFDGSGTPFAVAGYPDIKGKLAIAAVEAGKSVGVLLADVGETIEVGAQVYITANGKFTAVAGTSPANTPTAATFASQKGDAIDLVSGVKIANGGALIDMIGGF